ncbi:MAG: helix-turn-helix domain-containing protein [Chloroflexota bacterium]|nr:helix-turn-helix domain-containing protein [Chloroflexota bacterium]
MTHRRQIDDRRPAGEPSGAKPSLQPTPIISDLTGGVNPDPLACLTVERAAALTTLAPATISALCRRGELPASHVGRRWVIRRCDLAAWLDGQKVAPLPVPAPAPRPFPTPTRPPRRPVPTARTAEEVAPARLYGLPLLGAPGRKAEGGAS